MVVLWGHNEAQKTATAPAIAATAKLMSSALAAPFAEAIGGNTLDVEAAAARLGLWVVVAAVEVVAFQPVGLTE